MYLIYVKELINKIKKIIVGSGVLYLVLEVFDI